MMRSCPVPAHRHKGAIAVEFALVATILIPLIIGTVEFGRVLYAYDTLTKAVRSSARYVSVAKEGPADATVQAAARCIVVTGSPGLSGSGCANPAQLPGLTTAMVNIMHPSANPEVQSIETGSGQIGVITVAITSYPLSQIAAILYPSLSLANISVTVPFIFF